MSDAEKIRELSLALTVFIKCAYPVSSEINPRGWNWSEGWLDQAKLIGETTLKEVAA